MTSWWRKDEALKARIKEMEDERAEYGNPKELREMLKTLPAKMNYLRSIYKDRDQRLNWARKKLVKYLRSKGERVPTGITFTRWQISLQEKNSQGEKVML